MSISQDQWMVTIKADTADLADMQKLSVEAKRLATQLGIFRPLSPLPVQWCDVQQAILEAQTAGTYRQLLSAWSQKVVGSGNGDQNWRNVYAFGIF